MTARETFREEGEDIEFDRLGQLTSPVAIAAFEGWNDAGEAASGVISHLGIAWQAQPIAAVEPEDFYDFQVTRPVVEITEGRIERLVWPTTRLSVARAVAWPGPAGVPGPAGPDSPDLPESAARDADPGGGDPGVSIDSGDDAAVPTGTGLDRDIILVHGIEPNMRWRSFTDELVQGLTELGVESVILLGALLADAPHTRPVPVSVGAADPKLSATVTAPFSDYKGPTGILGVVQYALAGAGIPAVSLWASVPHYVAQPPNPKATLALLRGVEDILDAPLPLADLAEEARAWERGVDELAQQDSEVADYVRTLEEAKDATDLPQASGDAIAREFERYLRRRGRRGEPGGL
ncbi:MAG: PAC2 family protein [Streptosporangiaceae bacterium]